MQRLDPDKSIKAVLSCAESIVSSNEEGKGWGYRERPELIYFHEMLSLLSLQLKAATATAASMQVWSLLVLDL